MITRSSYFVSNTERALTPSGSGEETVVDHEDMLKHEPDGLFVIYHQRCVSVRVAARRFFRVIISLVREICKARVLHLYLRRLAVSPGGYDVANEAADHAHNVAQYVTSDEEPEQP